MNVLKIAPIQWSTLKDISDVKPLNDGDTDCFVEIREVLRKYDKLERFGVALLHSHFDLADDEIMLESSDEESRTLVTTAVKQANAGTSNIGTVWMLREGDATTMSWCRSYCKAQSTHWGSHRKAHTKAK